MGAALRSFMTFFSSGLTSPEMLATDGVPTASLFYKLAIAFILAAATVGTVSILAKSPWVAYLCIVGAFLCTVLMFLSSRNDVSREARRTPPAAAVAREPNQAL